MIPENITMNDAPRLVGTLCFAGDLDVNGEQISGCALAIDRETLIAAKALPMYKKCVIITFDELQKMEAAIESVNQSRSKAK